MSTGLNYTCPKCSSMQCDVGELRGAGGFWSKIFDVQSQRFTTVSCTRCRFTEVYKADKSNLEDIFDLFTS